MTANMGKRAVVASRQETRAASEQERIDQTGERKRQRQHEQEQEHDQPHRLR